MVITGLKLSLSTMRMVLVALVGMVFVASCSDNSLKRRMEHCDSYVKLGHLNEVEKSKCYSDQNVYRKGASSLSATLVANSYPALVRAKLKLDKHFLSFDKSNYRPLPDNVEFPLFMDESEAKNSWRYFVKLENVTLVGPSDGEGSKNWAISGSRSSSKKFEHVTILGVAPYAIQELEGMCDFFAYSKNLNGCTATIYVDIATDGEPLPSVTVMALEFFPPTEREALSAVLEEELAAWLPSEAR